MLLSKEITYCNKDKKNNAWKVSESANRTYTSGTEVIQDVADYLKEINIILN